MQPEFWHERWATRQTGFHEPVANPLLLKYFPALELPRGARVFVPLCGKTLDIDWLLAQGYRVAGAELSTVAVTELFERLGQRTAVETSGALQKWHAGDLEIWVGDLFQLKPSEVGSVDGVYDRAALVAMPPQMRADYASQLTRLAGGAPQLLITIDYDQSLQDGPPFSVGARQVQSLYPGHSAQALGAEPIAGGLKGKCPASEQVWLLRPTPSSPPAARSHP